MTLPPRAWIAEMSLPKDDLEIGWVVSPFQYAVHEPGASVCRKAMVRYLLPDAAASAAGLCPVQASKYGAETRAGMAPGRYGDGPAPAARAPPSLSATSPAARPVTVTQDNNARSTRRERGRLTDAPKDVEGRGWGRTTTIFGLDQLTVKVLYDS